MSKTSRLMLVFFIWDVAYLANSEPPTDTQSTVFTFAVVLLCGILGALFIMLGDER